MNTCYKHFYYFVTEFDLINEKEFAPLQEMTRRICTDIIAPPTPTGEFYHIQGYPQRMIHDCTEFLPSVFLFS